MMSQPRSGQLSPRHCRVLLPLSVYCLGSSLPLAAGPVPADKPADFPAWWFERDVIPRLNPNEASPEWPEDYPASQDFAPLNQGQLKTMVKAAVDDLNNKLPPVSDTLGVTGGAGRPLNTLVAEWAPAPGVTPNDFAAMNVGQLKRVSALVYDRLIAAGYHTAYPWGSGTGTDNYHVANLGQLKQLFSFDITGFTNDHWTGIGGTDLSTIPLATVPGSPGTPGSTGTTRSSFESLDRGDNYGERISGYLTVPVSGVYRFWLTASGTAELYISNDHDPVNSLLRAEVKTPTGFRAWGSGGKSPLLWLERDRSYYVEVRHKAGTGDDHFSVGWLKATNPAHPDPDSVTAPVEIVPDHALTRRIGGSAPVFTPPAPLTWSDPENSSNPESRQNYNAAVRFLTQATFGASGWATAASYDIDGVWTNATLAGSGSSVVPYDVGRVQTLGFDDWIDEQMKKPGSGFVTINQTRLHDYVQKKRTWDHGADPTMAGSGNHYWLDLFYAAWWRTAITGRDQLRQRVAFALSEIMVISNTALNPRSDACSDYYDDALAKNAFGSFRNILEDVTTHPAMGLYLNMLKNKKPDYNPALVPTARVPNENYARELLQLFSIGMYRLNPDGTLLLNSTNQPVPTYDQKTVEGIAHVFTGWDYDFDDGPGGYNPQRYNPWFQDLDLRNQWQAAWDAEWDALKAIDPNAPRPPVPSAPVPPADRLVPEYLTPMIPNPDDHFTGQKRILNNVVLPGMAKLGTETVPAYQDPVNPIPIPSGLSSSTTYQELADKELDAVLDAIFHHPNCGPFICRQLIQRLVTSNPSPDYVYRVVSVFNNDGTSGIDPVTGHDRHNGRGNMDSVIKAILLDHEARSATKLSDDTFGKQREPVCRITAIARAFPSTESSANLWNVRGTSFVPAAHHWQQDLNQTPLGAPSVFNFFRPDYQFPGILAEHNLTTPEFQLTTTTSVINQANFVHDAFFQWGPRSESAPNQGLASFLQGSKTLCMDLRPWMGLTGNTDLETLIDELNKRLMAGQLPAAAKQVIKNLVSTRNFSVSVAGGTATFTVAGGHGLADEDRIVFHPGPSEWPRKAHVVSVTGPTTFTIPHDANYGTYSGQAFSGLFDNSARERLFSVVNLIVNSPDFIIQR